MSKYWFYDMQTLNIITVEAESCDVATTEAKRKAGHTYVSLFAAVSI